ncbi:YbaB/EbfC family nucleoid-associated protein [Paractinoplanes durhamensis]|uniref:YbaB/EbfC DNA-binding family protein n=1 Tax=Paractinoplanes durhamensis TaxID=113563 RepID=A0ABQ3Z2V9_9ACTN|nr:YbaB/EbfC family nucleoid-associated protein [Actinoplanes durhamensis]GIE04175.1 hypothetical protein Adu01nite_55250 [Actinoplanes durhamensis]
MTSPQMNQVEQAMAEFERQKAALGEIERGLHGSSTTVVAKNRAVAVTVNSSGAVAEIKFPTSAYRSMSGAELGDLLVSTIEEARAEAMAQTMQAFAAVLPGGQAMVDAFTGRAGGNVETPLEKLLAEVLLDGDRPDDGPAGR